MTNTIQKIIEYVARQKTVSVFGIMAEMCATYDQALEAINSNAAV